MQFVKIVDSKTHVVNDIDYIVKKILQFEKDVRRVHTNLKTAVYWLFYFPVSILASIGIIKFPTIIIETENYWIVDFRFAPTLLTRLIIALLNIIVITYFWDTFRLLTVFFPFFLIFFVIFSSFLDYYMTVIKGYGTEIYHKDWVTAKMNGYELYLSVNVPRNSRINFFQYTFQSPILDFLGVTKNKTSSKIQYYFQITST